MIIFFFNGLAKQRFGLLKFMGFKAFIASYVLYVPSNFYDRLHKLQSTMFQNI